MQKSNPNKWIRKAIFTAINNMSVNGLTIPCYDTRVKPSEKPNYYVLMTSQTKRVIKQNKCEYFWESSILLDIVTKYTATSNTGSRVLVDDIEDKVRELTNNLVIEGFENMFQNIEQNGLDNINENNMVYRNLLRITLTIK